MSLNPFRSKVTPKEDEETTNTRTSSTVSELSSETTSSVLVTLSSRAPDRVKYRSSSGDVSTRGDDSPLTNVTDTELNLVFGARRQTVFGSPQAPMTRRGTEFSGPSESLFYAFENPFARLDSERSSTILSAPSTEESVSGNLDETNNDDESEFVEDFGAYFENRRNSKDREISTFAPPPAHYDYYCTYDAYGELLRKHERSDDMRKKSYVLKMWKFKMRYELLKRLPWPPKCLFGRLFFSHGYYRDCCPMEITMDLYYPKKINYNLGGSEFFENQPTHTQTNIKELSRRAAYYNRHRLLGHNHTEFDAEYQSSDAGSSLLSSLRDGRKKNNPNMESKKENSDFQKRSMKNAGPDTFGEKKKRRDSYGGPSVPMVSQLTEKQKQQQRDVKLINRLMEEGEMQRGKVNTPKGDSYFHGKTTTPSAHSRRSIAETTRLAFTSIHNALFSPFFNKSRTKARHNK